MQIADSLTVDKKQTNNLSNEIWVIDERDLVVENQDYLRLQFVRSYSLNLRVWSL